MAEAFSQGNKLYVAGRDFSSNWTALELQIGREMLDWTKGSDTTRVAKMGLLTAAMEVEGVTDFDTDVVDDELFAANDLTSSPIIIIGHPGSTSGESGQPGYAMRADVAQYNPFNASEVGQRVNFGISARANRSRIVRGTFMHDGDTARTATGNGTAYQLGAVSATQKLYAAIMCLSCSAADTLDVVIASDNAEGFPSGTTRATFAQITATAATEWVEVAGPFTDDWWRVQYTLGGASISIRFVVLLAISNAP